MSSPLHMSDCALHNGPATPPGPCDCGATPKRGRPRGSTNKATRVAQDDLGIALAVLSQIADMDPMPPYQFSDDQLVKWAQNNARTTYDRLTKKGA